MTGPISLVFAIKYMASKEWDRMRYGRVRATKFTDRGPISLVKREPPPHRRFDGVGDFWPDKHSAGDMPYSIIDSQVSQTRAWTSPPPPRLDSISSRSNSDLATLYCPRVNTTSLDEGMFKIQNKHYGRRWGRILDGVG